jgi:hypothetical protein
LPSDFGILSSEEKFHIVGDEQPTTTIKETGTGADYMSVTVIKVRPPGYFTHISIHAHHLRLEKLLYLELSRSSSGF